MKILVVHEVNYLNKIIYEFQILPEILSILGHEVTVIDYDDSWKTSRNGHTWRLKTDVHERVHRAYSRASVTVRRPGMIRLPMVSRVSGAITSGVDTEMFSPGPRNSPLLQQWGIRPEDEVILFMGTIYKFSGLDRIIRDFPRLLSRHARAKLLVVGCGEDEERLKAIAAEAEIS